jgi:Flp pilus assembly protein TadG
MRKGPADRVDSPDEFAPVRVPSSFPVPGSRAGGILRRLRGESGQGVVEFAMVVPLLCTLVLVFVDFGKAMNYWIDTTQAANEGARLAAVNIDVTKSPYNGAGATSLQQYIKQGIASSDLRSGASVSICYPSGTTLGSPVTVKVSYPYVWIPFIGATTTVVGKATLRLEHDATATPSQVGTCP